MTATLLVEYFPELATELETLLRAEEEPALADQVSSLRIIDRCRCGDDFCATFYTVPKPTGPWGVNHRNVALTPKSGDLILDVVDNKITCVEVLFRNDIRDKLLSLLP